MNKLNKEKRQIKMEYSDKEIHMRIEFIKKAIKNLNTYNVFYSVKKMNLADKLRFYRALRKPAYM